MSFTREELSRYSRHLMLPEVGLEGQEKLKRASVLLVGLGGLGSPIALYLAAAGLGRIGLADFDVVDTSNLQRQVIHSGESVGRLKVDSAADRLGRLNPFVDIQPYRQGVGPANAGDILKDYDMVVGATDNFETRYALSDAAVRQGKPNVYGAIHRFDGQVAVFPAGGRPCYRCLFPEAPPPDMAAPAGVLGVLPGIVGLIQAAEVLKLILGRGRSLAGRLLLFNALEMGFKELPLRGDPACPACGRR